MPSTLSWAEWRTILTNTQLPAMVLDLPAIRRNLQRIIDNIATETVAVRLFVPELSCPALIRELLQTGSPHFQGLACRTIHEAQQLVDLGLNDVLITQPIEHSIGADQLGHLCAKGASLVATADSHDHLALLNHAAQALSTNIFLSIDVDVSADPGGRTEIREVQSPIKDSEQARQIARKIAEMEHLQVTGIQASLPAQIRAQSRRWKRRKQTKVLAAIQDRRVAVVHALRSDGHDIQLVSGGKPHDIAATTTDPTISEILLGRELLGVGGDEPLTRPALERAAFFVMPASRWPDERHILCQSGLFADVPLQLVDPIGFAVQPDCQGAPFQTLLRMENLAPEVVLGDPMIFETDAPDQILCQTPFVMLLDDEAQLTQVPTLRSL